MYIIDYYYIYFNICYENHFKEMERSVCGLCFCVHIRYAKWFNEIDFQPSDEESDPSSE